MVGNWQEGWGKFNSVGSIANWFTLTKLISKTSDRHGYIVHLITITHGLTIVSG